MAHPTLDLKRTYLALRRAIEATVRPFGVTSGQFDVLQQLMHEGELEHRELQARLAVASPTLTNLVDVLERNGHVVRQASADDARVKTIAITRSAHDLCWSKEFCDAGDALVDAMFEGFTRKERQAFLKMLARVRENLEAAGG